MSITYGVVKEIYALGSEKRSAYGLVAYYDAEEDGTATIVASAHDLSDDEAAVEMLAERCNDGDLSLVHFDDVIEDFLAG